MGRYANSVLGEPASAFAVMDQVRGGGLADSVGSRRTAQRTVGAAVESADLRLITAPGRTEDFGDTAPLLRPDYDRK